MGLTVRRLNKDDLAWVKKAFIKEWGGDFIISRGKIYKCENLEGFIAEENDEKVGLITFSIECDEMEIVSIKSMKQKQGIGTVLLDEAKIFGRKNKIKRIFLVTTNDNLNALRFYQKRGFYLSKIYPGSINEARKTKPQIPEIGKNGIPLRDEIELEYKLINLYRTKA